MPNCSGCFCAISKGIEAVDAAMKSRQKLTLFFFLLFFFAVTIAIALVFTTCSAALRLDLPDGH
ncbi:hypothetical protein CfE428DRAFT_6331 [Chthoniobacter flavus Ellin428]|uniref:Transmembrane protein n=1 Tax=Chthoniobacter flavus Ellin428 TaxID=497964 RepID=B4DBP0_9BACT|nr:hypothetical protein CfE428DRAFT_6331 [Chthoniobacter flavus Ellin428]